MVIFQKTSFKVTSVIVPIAPSSPVILWNKAYLNDIDIQWRMPCSPNGRVTAYEVQYWEVGKTDISKRQFKADKFSDRLSGLKTLTDYRIQLRAATRSGFGDSAFLTLRTLTGVPGIFPLFFYSLISFIFHPIFII